MRIPQTLSNFFVFDSLHSEKKKTSSDIETFKFVFISLPSYAPIVQFSEKSGLAFFMLIL